MITFCHTHVCKFNDCLTGSHLHYDWDKIRPTITRLNHILMSATTPSSTSHTVRLVAIATPFTTIGVVTSHLCIS